MSESKTYISELNKREARPRSKRLRQLGASASGGSGSTVLLGSSGSAIPTGDGHTHANKKYLDQLTTDTDDYLYLTQNREVEDPDTGEVTNENQTNKVKSGYADKAHDLDEDTPANDRYLRKDQDDRTEHTLHIGGNLKVGGMTDEEGNELEGGSATFEGDTEAKGNASVGGDLTVGGAASVDGDATVGGNSTVGGSQSVTGDSIVGGQQTVMGDSNIGGSHTVEGSQTVKGDSLIEGLLSLLTGAASTDFLAGFLGTGFELRRVAETGRWRMEIDELMVRVVATFFELVIQKLRHVGGAIVLTPASMQCVRVEETADAYRCYFKQSEGGKTIANEFVVGDQARCQSFNLKNLDGGGVQTSFYWRLVTDVGDDWIELSKTDCAELSGVPAAGDDIVQLGNRDDASRQNAIILDTTGSDAPSIKQYHGIDGYVLTDDMAVTVLSPAGNRIRGQFISEATGAGVDDSLSALGKQLVSIGEQMKGIKVNVDTIKAQTDREFTMWLMDVDPTTSNFPASEWTTEELKSEHVEDMYYNEDAGHAWIWTRGEDGVYYWKDITDKDTLRALEKAAKAQDTADRKRRNFVSQPTDADAYDVGDTWSNAEWTGKYYQDLLVCITAKAAGEAFSIDHWKAANFATFARLAVMEDNIYTTVANNKAAADAAIAEAQSAASAAQTAASKASASASNAQSAADSAKDIADKAHDTADKAQAAATANATAIVQNTNAISALSGKFKFDSEGNVENIDTSGLVLTSDFATLYSESVKKDTNVVKRAEISTMVTKDANGYLQSGVKVKADQINLEGYTTINGGFKVDTNGNVTMKNAVVDGYVMEVPHQFSGRVGKFYLNPYYGNVFIAKTSNYSSGQYAYYKLPAASICKGRFITVVALSAEWITEGSSSIWHVEMEHANRFVITSDGFGVAYNTNEGGSSPVYVGGKWCSKIKLDPMRGIYRFFSDGSQWYESGGNYDNLQATSDELSGTFASPIN